MFLLGDARVVTLVGFLGVLFASLLLSPTMGMEKNPWEILTEREQIWEEELPSLSFILFIYPIFPLSTLLQEPLS